MLYRIKNKFPKFPRLREFQLLVTSNVNSSNKCNLIHKGYRMLSMAKIEHCLAQLSHRFL